MSPASGEITRLLSSWREGDKDALDQVMALVYDDLRDMARHYLRSGPTPTLPSRALVHELYLKLAGGVNVDLQDRTHFVAVTARMLRNIAVDYCRAESAQKRGGGLVRVEDFGDTAAGCAGIDVLGLDQALARLQGMDPRSAELVELRFFGGLSVPETAEAMGISEATVKRDWVFAKTWLLATMSGTQNESSS
jgi:RNA polymerase sigma factor (TIGR02999 family)